MNLLKKEFTTAERVEWFRSLTGWLFRNKEWWKTVQIIMSCPNCGFDFLPASGDSPVCDDCAEIYAREVSDQQEEDFKKRNPPK